MGKIRGANSSPGIYTQITDLQYAANSLGITTLGLVGETLKGPAFEPIAISNWAEFQDYFGGTSTELFGGSKYPKYELPYIAKSYLQASDQLYVCRVLGLSGYNAGPAFVLYQIDDNKKNKVIGILRSKAEYSKPSGDACDGNGDNPSFFVSSVDSNTAPTEYYATECGQETSTADTKNIHTIIKLTWDGVKTGSVVVSVLPGSKNYIYNVLGSSPSSGSYPIYVEALYDLEIDNEKQIYCTPINEKVTETEKVETKDFEEYIKGKEQIVVDEVAESSTAIFSPNEGDLYKKVLIKQSFVDSDNNYNSGEIYRVEKVYDKESKKDKYYLLFYTTLRNNLIAVKHTYKKDENEQDTEEIEKSTYYAKIVDSDTHGVEIKVLDDTVLYENGLTKDVLSKTSDYKWMFQHAVTPWFVSELGGKITKSINNYYTAKKLFRLHTISDGDAANSQVKISIANIKPEDGTFDVLVRSFNDTDANPIILESYKSVNLIPGSSSYLGLRMGTMNGDYPLKSKYVIAEIIESEETEMSVPCGFLGYPVHQIETSGFTNPSMHYNNKIDTSRRINKQYFGLSDIDGIDVDMLYFKGCAAYSENAETTEGFHLDYRAEDGLIVDNSDDTYKFTTVDSTEKVPVMTPESEMKKGIYADVKARKFTCCPYGGFDGWDVNRTMRTTDDMFRVNNYTGLFFKDDSMTDSVDGLALPDGYNSSDYYAYLAGANQFSNPDRFTINLFATPGIDCINNKLLTSDIVEMVENRKDTFYVITTPDKPMNSDESVDEMYTPSDVVGKVDDTGIDTYYASTYYPWVRYYDATNARYISLPVTKDVLRNMADVDNKKYPWYAPAGIERGNVECNRARIFTKIDDENTIYDGRINPVKTFSSDGVKIWGNKTLYSGDTPMNRINTVRLVLYMRKLVSESVRSLIFEPNDTTLKKQFEGIIKPILSQIKNDRGITDFRLKVSQTPEQMDAHEISAQIHIKPTPTLEYIELDFVVTPQGVEWDE